MLKTGVLLIMIIIIYFFETDTYSFVTQMYLLSILINLMHPCWISLISLRFIFGIFAFIIIGPCRDDRRGSGREMGVGSGKVLELGFELGSPVTQQHYMSARCPRGRISLKIYIFLKILLTPNIWSVYFFVNLPLPIQLFQNETDVRFFLYSMCSSNKDNTQDPAQTEPRGRGHLRVSGCC